MATNNLGLVQAIHSGLTAPSNTKMLWYDENVNLHKYYDTSSSLWVTINEGMTVDPTAKLADFNAVSNYIYVIGDFITINLDDIEAGSRVSFTYGSTPIYGDVIELEVTTGETINGEASPYELKYPDSITLVRTDTEFLILSNFVVDGKPMVYKGTWDATTNTPDLTAISIQTGWYYDVIVDGNTLLGTVNDWEIGDWAVKTDTSWLKNNNSGSGGSSTGITNIDGGSSSSVYLITQNIDGGGAA